MIGTAKSREDFGEKSSLFGAGSKTFAQKKNFEKFLKNFLH